MPSGRLPARCIALLLAGACALPTPTARSSADYSRKAAHTADVVRSAVQTASLAVRTTTEDKVPSPTLDVLVTESEADASGADAVFRSIDPPSEDDTELRDATLELTGEAIDALEALRIDVRHGAHLTTDTADDLDDLADELDEFHEAHKR